MKSGGHDVQNLRRLAEVERLGRDRHDARSSLARKSAQAMTTICAQAKQ
jgi:hypothetical protein